MPPDGTVVVPKVEPNVNPVPVTVNVESVFASVLLLSKESTIKSRVVLVYEAAVPAKSNNSS